VSKVLLDSSAVLAALFDEAGAAVVRDRAGDGSLLAANLCEVLSKLNDRGVPAADAEAVVTGLNLEILPVDEAVAVRAARLRDSTRKLGFSLADRLCLACASVHHLPVLTADRSWAAVALGVEVVQIRP
jgi:PIN domain nuclease of toxin-antitoxin system